MDKIIVYLLSCGFNEEKRDGYTGYHKDRIQVLGGRGVFVIPFLKRIDIGNTPFYPVNFDYSTVKLLLDILNISFVGHEFPAEIRMQSSKGYGILNMFDSSSDHEEEAYNRQDQD